MSQNESPETRFAASFSGGFITALALWTGAAKALWKAGLVEQLQYIIATSAGSFVGAVLATRNPQRVTEMETYVRNLKPAQVYRRRSLWQLGISHLLLIVSMTLESWRKLAKKREPIAIKRGRGLLFAVLALATLAALLVPPYALLLFVGVAWCGTYIVPRGVVYGLHIALALARRGSVALFLARINRFLLNPKLHADAFNDPVFIEDIPKYFNAEVIAEELACSPTVLEVVYTNMRKWRSEVWSSRVLKEAWEERMRATEGNGRAIAETEWDIAARQFAIAWTQEVQTFRTALYASASANVFFPPVREAGQILADGALLRPDPLGYAYDAPVDKILHFAVRDDEPPHSELLMLHEAIMHPFLAMQHELKIQEARNADEKTISVKELRKLRADMQEMWRNFLRGLKERLSVGLPETHRLLLDDEFTHTESRGAKAIADRFAQNRFPFRHDQPTDSVDFLFSSQPGIPTAIFGGHGDFSAIPEVIERGYQVTFQRLRQEGLLQNGNGKNS